MLMKEYRICMPLTVEEVKPARLALLLLLNLSLQQSTRPEEQPLPHMTVMPKNPERSPLDPDLGEEIFYTEVQLTPSPPRAKRQLVHSNLTETESEKVDFGVSQTETTLQWVPFRKTSDIEGGYKVTTNGHEQYVCRPEGLCTSGYLQLSDGYFCTYSLAKRVYTTENFKVLVNKDDFELLQWKHGQYGSVPPYSIKVCGSNFVGKNRYGLGNVNTQEKKFYLPWISDQSEYSYSGYEVLTVVDEPCNQHVSQVSYLTEKANITRHQPQTLKKSRATNNNNQQITKTVILMEATESVSTWETGFSRSHSVSASISAGIPYFGEVEVGYEFETRTSQSESNSISQSKEHSVSVEVVVPPGHTCEVRMEGTKAEAVIPYTALLTKTYKDGRERHTKITGLYRGIQVGEINAVVEQCAPILVGTERVNGVASPSTRAPGNTSLVALLATLAAVIIS